MRTSRGLVVPIARRDGRVGSVPNALRRLKSIDVRAVARFTDQEIYSEIVDLREHRHGRYVTADENTDDRTLC